MAIECFEIKWTKLFPLSEIANQPEIKQGGVYARIIITGGTKKLHYIGKSTDFRQRTRYHRQATSHLGFDLKKHYISLGIVSVFDGIIMSPKCTSNQLNDVESYLRNTARPKGNDPSTLKGYNGSPIIIVNTGTIPKPLKKFMSHSPILLKVLGKGTTTKKRASSYPF
jgi:hypothetical protein